MQLEAKNISFRYDKKSPWVLKDVSLSIQEGERVGIVAPSGFGKTTLARILAGYEKPSEGQVLIDGKELPSKVFCPVQLIYQHPELSVNPRWRMEKTLNEQY